MRNKILAAAVTAAITLPLAAQAESVKTGGDLSVYGRLNLTLERIKMEDGGHNELVDNYSRFGLRGSSDLGDGLTGIFQIETRFRPDDAGAGTIANRDTWLGMKGGFGTVKFGRLIGPVYYGAHDYVGMHNHETGNSSDTLYYAANSAFVGVRNNNAIYYGSPSLGGFTVEAQYSLLTEDATIEPTQIELNLSFDQGGLHASGGIVRAKDASAVGNTDTAVVAAATYDLKVAAIGALVQRDESEPASGTSVKRNYFRVSGMVPVGKSEFHLNVGVANDYSGTSDTGAKQYTVAYNYNLSKQAKVYAFVTKIDNDEVSSGAGGGTYGFDTATVAPGIDSSSVAVGYRLNF